MLVCYLVASRSAPGVLLRCCSRLYSTQAASGADQTPNAATTGLNACYDAVRKGVTSVIVPFERNVDDAVDAFDAFQSSKHKWLHAHGLFKKARISPVYLPFWAFSCTVTAEYRGFIGAKDQRWVLPGFATACMVETRMALCHVHTT